MSTRIAIAGGGISGLSLAYALLDKNPALDVTVYEADTRPGGKIYTERVDSYLCEAGVNGFLDNKPATLELAKKLGLPPIKSNDNARKRYIYFDGDLRMIPTDPAKFFLSNFLTLGGRLRMMSEYFIAKKIYDDESLKDFAVRRVGTEFYEKLLDPMASGIYAGDPEKMSIRSCFGKVYDLEQKYGGLIKGFMAVAKEKKEAGGGGQVEAGPGGTLMSFEHGMYSLIQQLSTFLGQRLVTGKRLIETERAAHGYTLHFADGSQSDSDYVVITAPAHDMATAVKGIDSGIAMQLRDIPYPALSVVAFGYRKEQLTRDLNLFGFLIPAREKRQILGTLFDTSIFPNRAPQDRVLLRVMIGGARAEERAMLPDDKLIDTAISELAAIADVKADPELIKVYRWKQAIPQYHVNHHKRIETIETALIRHKGLYLGGNAFRGVAVNDCIGNGYRLADQIIADMGK
ncbi:MAG TPA: protoporphyrinogen oxidase [Dissulfurispiraceae bacterium]|nr:protoporphyrinogen oxidase [Dissulfurispiraceae bacterium]